MNKPLSADGTVGKALEVLDDVAQFGKPVRFSELLERSPHPKATLYRLLQTLTNQQMLVYNRDRQTYWLGLKLVRLAHAAWRQTSLAAIASPHLHQLAAEVGETVHIAQMDSGQVIFVDKKRRSDNFETLAQTGLIAPAHCTGVGKAILAFLSLPRLENAMRQQTFLQYTPNTLTSREGLEAEL
ncbi:MAG: IclR family transcriptional regulator, partial [Pseudomonadota bacterium]